MDEILHRYRLLAPFQAKNAGFSKWTFAEYCGREYFLKELLNPVYPDQQSLSDKLRLERVRECEIFEKAKIKLYDTVNQCSDGNLVRIQEFFREGSHYYVVMPRIHEEVLEFSEIQNYPVEDRILLCCTLAYSMLKLHMKHVVHADIKQTNVLIKKSKNGKLISKVIDYDCGFFEEHPPVSDDQLGGDQVYLSPEACLFMCGESVPLTCKMDVFSIGLLFHQYLTGELPGFSDEYDYPHEAVLDDQELKLSSELQEPLRKLIQDMLAADPKKRISLMDVCIFLDEYHEKLNGGSGRIRGSIYLDDTDVHTYRTTKINTRQTENLRSEQKEKYNGENVLVKAGDLF